jgi:endonuclease-3
VDASARRVVARADTQLVKAGRKTRAAAAVAGKKASAQGTKAPPGGKVGRARTHRADPNAVLERLSRAIPRPHVELAFRDAWQLLVAVILSAQSTDRRVNQVTPVVFERWPSPRALASAAPAEVEAVIKSTGFFRNKTKAIIGASALLAERFEGRVPRGMDELLQLPGVARKTANVVLGGAYQIASGIVVDTHAARVAQRLGLTPASEPEKIERDLCALFPQSEWIRVSHRLVLHGRYICTARAPACSSCPLNELCPARLEPGLGGWPERAAREASEMEARAAGFARV